MSRIIPGNLDYIDALSLSEIRGRIDTYYKPASAILVLAGDFDATAAAAMIEKFFSEDSWAVVVVE